MTGLAILDFETYSEAGAIWNPETQRYDPPPGAHRRGLQAVGAAAYAEHPSTEVLTLSYALPPDLAVRRWRPGEPAPVELFAYLATGAPIEAHNAIFEWLIWTRVCIPRYGFPAFSQYQMRCSMAKAHVAGYPGGLEQLSSVLDLPTPKDKDGKRLLDKFSVPRKPTKTDPRHRIRPEDDPEDFERLRAYCDTDIRAEHGASERLPPMTDDETLFWLVDQEINLRGVAMDMPAVRNCIAVLEQAQARYGEEFREITGGLNPTQLAATMGWLHGRGVHLASMDEETLEATASRDMPRECRRVIEIRQRIASASVKKLYAIANQACADDRLRNLYVHHGARTGRPTGAGPQPTNLPRSGPDVHWCAPPCGRPFKPSIAYCPWCHANAPDRVSKWSAAAVDHALEIIATRSLDLVEYYFGDALLTISGCLRGLFVAGPGCELIASDYSSIEAVVIAMLAGEQWRIDAFREGKPIYLLSISKITGRSLEYYLQYQQETGEHHPDRQAGKIAELSGGFGGFINAWRAFGATEPDDVLRDRILAWRAASPAIVALWGGQFEGRWGPPRLYGYEGAAIAAIRWPGTTYDYRGIQFSMRDHALIVRLLSGRELRYNHARLIPSRKEWARPGEVSIVYMTHNTNPKYGALGWMPMETYGGRICENITQATAHDIQRHGILASRAAGYPVVLHVYDENVCEIPEGSGSLDDFERIMSDMPAWAAGWPIRATGGYRGHRYRKG